ncbi:transcriptional regulator family: Fungal Specific TF [Penicillium malachiteum]|uniref:transcriptional regulator family: Fungal Specific TF n=1 Tax=Penicillium malachiteum TaxID=1324776 RepID=UPI002548C339|nr:transcriptional regulator family: Fungal Specific TF [Penicillium malachiteum]KAJ5731597.1 transcriptional regulator family: Fungal Specific TF [Penicillium malachiteum]
MPPTEVASFPAPERAFPRRVVKRRGTTRERTGCLTCRQRKKRCDLGQPVCKGCVRLNYMCRWEDLRTCAGDNDTSGSVQQVAQPVNVPFQLLQNPDPILFWVDEHSDFANPSITWKIIVSYLVGLVCYIALFYPGGADLILTVFLPMAMHSPPLLTSLIAWSSSHLSLRDTSFQQVAMQNRCAALRDLRSAINSDPANMEITLAMSLVLCSLESIMADNGHAWYLHLVGAAEIINSKLNTLESSGDSEQASRRMLQQFEDAYAGRWLLRNFAYRDIIMSVARDRAPLLKSYHFLRLEEPHLPDSHFGLASEILEILSVTSTLKEEIKTLFSESETEGEFGLGGLDDAQRSIRISEFMATLASLESHLIDWTCPSSPDMFLRLLAESYRSSALIYLYRVMLRACPDRQDELLAMTTGQVAAIVSSVEQIPTRSLPECTLLFPLFLAGGEATQESHIKPIRNRMLDMIRSRGFRNVEVALSVLEKLWRLRIVRKLTDTSVRIDWLHIVQQDEIHLSLS